MSTVYTKVEFNLMLQKINKGSGRVASVGVHSILLHFQYLILLVEDRILVYLLI